MELLIGAGLTSAYIFQTMASKIPDFDSLPAVEGMPQGCAWGIFDKDGRKDLRGTCREARDGVSISLK
jgi:hypothetical protein